MPYCTLLDFALSHFEVKCALIADTLVPKWPLFYDMKISLDSDFGYFGFKSRHCELVYLLSV